MKQLPIDIKLLFLTLTQLIVSNMQAQQALSFNRFTEQHGLPQNYFESVLQDRKGYIWFASTNGLIKYDGYSFNTFHPEPGNTNSLPDNYVRQLCEDSEGNIWILSGNNIRITRYNPHKEKFTTYSHHDDKYALSSDAVNCMVAGKNGSVWIGTNDAGLCRYDAATGNFINYGKDHLLPDTLCSNTIFALMIDHDGLLWIGTSKGVNIFDPVHKTLIAYKPDDKNKFAKYNNGCFLFEDHTHNVWIGYFDGGVARINRATGTVSRYLHSDNNPNSLSWNFVNDIMEDHNHTIWIATWKGLNAWQSQTDNFKVYLADANDKNTLSSNSVMNLYEDRSGVLWIATNGGGINNLDLNSKKFHVYQQQYDKDYATNYPLGMNKDHEGKILINTFGAGVCVFDPVTRQFKSFRFNKEQNSNHYFNATYCTLEDPGGTIWVGTTTEGLHTLDLKTGKFTTWHSNSNNTDTVAYNQINCLAEDKHGQLWIGTNTGLKCFNIKTKIYADFQKNFPGINQLNQDNITALYCDPQEILWIGGTGGGLTLLNTITGEEQVFKHDDKNPSSVSSNVINCFFDTGNEKVWIGTDAGLNLFDKKSRQFISYTTRDGLPGNSVTGIVADNNGNLWLSGDEGICRFTVPGVKNSKAICRNYNISDGLPGNEYYANSCVKAADGTFYFGSNAGIVAFKPDDLRDNSFIPPALITDFSIFNKQVMPNDSTRVLTLPVDETKEIKLSYRQNNFIFTFAAMSFVHPEKNQYAFKLDNYDKDWIYTDATKHYAGYTNLDPGEYTFQVKATNNDGIWNEKPTTLHLIITPPFWQTTWFRLLMIVLIAGTLYGIYRLRLKQMMRLQNIRNRISEDLHDDIGSTLNSISIYSEVAKQDKGKHIEALEMIGEASRKVIDSMSDIVWTINPGNDSFEDIILRMRSLAFNLLRAKNIEFSFKADESLNMIKLSMETRRNFFLIFKEAINNLLKYADATIVSIQLAREGSSIKLNIRDNGKGFDTTVSPNGNGLNNMKRRAKEMKATLVISSLPGTGTGIELIMKS